MTPLYTRAMICAALFAFSFSASAQCDPEGFDFGEAGFGLTPDGLTTFFADGTQGEDYEQIMYLLVPTNATQVDPALPDLPIDSIEIVAVNLLSYLELDTIPLDDAGLSVSCNNSGLCADECTYLAGSQGCAVLFGVPSMGGQFFISIDLLIWSTVFGFPLSAPQSFSGLELTISSSDGVEEQRLDFDGLGEIFPVPAQSELIVQLNAPCELALLDGVGRTVATHSNAVGRTSFDVSGLPAGVYVVRARDGEKVATRRVIVRH
jgi:hypothetical protein